MKIKTNIFDLAFILFFFGEVINYTTLSEVMNIEIYEMIHNIFIFIGCIVLVCKILNGKYSIKYLFIISIGFAIFLLSGLQSNTISIVCIYLFIIGCSYIDIEHFLKLARVCIITALVLVSICSVIDLIPNWVYMRNGVARYSLGFIYPSCLSSFFFSLTLISMYLHKENLTGFNFLCWELANFVVYLITDSRAAFLGTALACLVFFLVKSIDIKKIIWKKIFGLLVFIFPICGIGSYLLGKYYNGLGIQALLNMLSSNRIYYAHSALRTYGIPLFGQRISWIGFGGNYHNMENAIKSYNYVDNGFIKMMVNQGLVLLIVVIGSYTYICYRAYKEQNKQLCVALAIIAVYCLFESILIEFWYNPFIFYIGNYLILPLKKNMKHKQHVSTQYTV